MTVVANQLLSILITFGSSEKSLRKRSCIYILRSCLLKQFSMIVSGKSKQSLSSVLSHPFLMGQYALPLVSKKQENKLLVTHTCHLSHAGG
jgi:hypothetical protein